MPAVAGAAKAIDGATAVGGQRVGSIGLDYAVRQLVEVAVRALSPGINDPHTAMSVLDRLGAALCDAVSLHLPDGIHRRDGRLALIVPALDYGNLVDAMVRPHPPERRRQRGSPEPPAGRAHRRGIL